VRALGFVIRILALRSAYFCVDLCVRAPGFVIRIPALRSLGQIRFLYFRNNTAAANKLSPAQLSDSLLPLQIPP
jgi:hypothetical protein